MKRPLGWLLAAAALIALAACNEAPEETADPAPAKPAPVATEKKGTPSPEPTLEPPEPTRGPDLVFLPGVTARDFDFSLRNISDWQWSGGAVTRTSIGEESDGTVRNYAVAEVWLPEMDGASTCVLDLWPEADASMDRDFSVSATWSDDPSVWLAFSEEVAAHGLQEQSRTSYAQKLEPETCELGPRIQLGEPVLGDVHGLYTLFVGSAESSLAIYADGEVFGLDADKGEVMWTLPMADTASTSSAWSAAPDLVEVLSPFEETVYGDMGRQGFHSITTGEQLYLSPPDNPGDAFSSTGVWFGPHTALLEKSGSGYFLLDGETMTDLGELPIWGAEWRSLYLTQDPATGAPVAVGYGYDVEKEERFLAYLNQDLEIVEILSAEKMVNLAATLDSVSNGVVYIRTTDEFVAVSLDGQQVGAALAEVPDAIALGDQRLGDSNWTLWAAGRMGAGQGDDAYVTRDGVTPW